MKYDAILLLKTTDYNPNLLKEFKKREDDDRGYPTTQISRLSSEIIH